MEKLILFLLIMLILTFNLSAQNKFITEEEYNEALIKAAKKQESIPRRVTGVINFYDAKKVIYEKRTSIAEHFSSDKYRIFSKTEKNGIITAKYEFVKIENVEYSKTGDESWKKKELLKGSDSKSGSGFFTGEPIKTQKLEEFLLIPTAIDDETVNVYFHYEVEKIGNDNNLTFIESRNSISGEGLTLKWIYKVSNTIPENISHISTTTYEYNPKDLKIEAPIK